ncbi:MAG TPA: DUF418 domain-containing protein [Candidatus Kapabacteria bacterium]|nr:DUF418 domain-containing protein [Candidatus Kapabacteria bacterium]
MFDSLKNSQIVPNQTHEMKPISVQERFPIIDVLRGVAILCILFLNMLPFSFPDNFHSFYLKMFNGMGDTIIYELVEFFGRGKFYSMLAFLFGLGMAVQVSRSLDTDNKFSWFYSRRLLLLLAIGLFHDLFLWGGIILIIYSTMGFFLLFFKKRQPKTLLTWAVIFFLMPVLINVIFPHKKPAPPANVNQQQAADLETKKVQEAIKIYQEGSYGDMFHLRLQKLERTVLITARAGWSILALFLLGIWAWQKRIFQDLEKNLKFLKKTWRFSLALGLGGTAIHFLADKLFNPGQSLAVEIIGGLIQITGTTGLSFFYIISIVFLYRKAAWRKILKPLEATGRMALSNYFLQSLLCTALFYSYGFKLFGKTGPLMAFLLVFPISAVQVLFSAWWIKHFRFGPVEWLWRSLTYGKWQKIV